MSQSNISSLSVSEGFAAYFARIDPDSLRVTYDSSIDPLLIVGSLDDSGCVHWQPLAASQNPRFDSIGNRLSAVVREYFSSTWFLYVGGDFEGYELALNGISPMYFEHIENYVLKFWQEREGDSSWVPIGMERSDGNALVLANCDGDDSVAIEDVHNGSIKRIAPHLADMLRRVKSYHRQRSS